MILSIIVTVYNCEKYLERCLHSLEKQSYRDFETVIVDDGSTDESGKISDRFAKTRANMKVIHKQNGGTVSARKSGLLEAKGNVVGFIDGDDWVDRDYCLNLITPFIQNEKIDVVTSGLFFEYVSEPEKNHTLIDGAETGLYGKEKIEEKLLSNCIYDIRTDKSAITTSICCKMIKKDIALRAMDDMDEGLTFGEDGAYVMSVLLLAENLFVISQAFYHYEQHVGSQNYKFEIYAYEQLKRLQECMRNIAIKNNRYSLLKSQIECYIKGYLRNIDKSVFDIDEDGRVYLFPELPIELNSRLIIHGAGKVGQQYIKYLKKTDLFQLVAWTDKNNNSAFVGSDMPCSNKEIEKLKFEYIVLASNDDYILNQMKNDLCMLNIPERKILVKKPISYKI